MKNSAEENYLYSSWVKMGMREGWRTVISTTVLLDFTGSPSSKAITNNCSTQENTFISYTQMQAQQDYLFNHRSHSFFLSVVARCTHIRHSKAIRMAKQDPADHLQSSPRACTNVLISIHRQWRMGSGGSRWVVVAEEKREKEKANKYRRMIREKKNPAE